MDTTSTNNANGQDAEHPGAMLAAALDYASRDLPVFPCWPSGELAKKPHTKHGFKDATTDQVQINVWWTKWPTALIGMPTGATTNLDVLDVDIDPHKGKDGEASLKALHQQHGLQLPPTCVVRTPRGGRHIYFQHPGIKVPSRTDWPGDALDVRGDGGYVILPPSRTSTGCYAWEGNVAEAAPLPDWLCELLTREKTPSSSKSTKSTAPPPIPRFTDSTQPEQGTNGEFDQVSAALKFIPAFDRTVWRNVGFGLKTHFGDAGWDIFDEWSKSADESYEAEVNRAQWESFKPDGGITIGTVFHLAKQHGWNSEQSRFKPASSAADYLGVDTSSRPAAASNELKPRSLTLRSPDELLGMTFDDSDIILGDRIVAQGQPVVIAGAGGTGKSRLVLQMAASIITGRQWLNFATGGRDMHWLILQTENSNRRLQKDLRRIKAWLGDEGWERFTAQVVLHTLEKDDDGFVSLDAPENQVAIQQAIASRNFGVVVIDPLNDFVAGDPNKDSDMKNSLQILSRLCRRGNPNRAIVVLHHSLTGRAGAARATGHDRASFARNSKVLHAWTRGQINLAAVDADSNKRLIVACGKCSNGQEFPAFGIALNPESMIYSCDSTIDIEGWAVEMGGTTSGPDLSPVVVAGIVRELTQTIGAPKKSHVVKALRDETGCASSGAYNAIKRAERANQIRLSKATKSYAAT